MFDYTATYTDQYQLTMAQAYFLKGRGKQRAVFDYFFRKLPFGGGYTVFTGLEDLLEVLQDLRFDKADLEFLAGQGFSKIRNLQGGIDAWSIRVDENVQRY